MDHKLPEGWVWTYLGEIADTTSGGTPLRSHPEFYAGDIPWVKSGELRDNIIRDVEESITELGLKNSSAKIFPKDTVVVALYGATVGKTGILGLDAASNQAVCAIFPRNDSFIPEYMCYWLQSQRQHLIDQSVGGAQPNISQSIIRSLTFPRAPLPEQERIVRRIESLFTRLDAGVAGLKRAQAALKRYRASVLKAACEGRLVPQDPSDEPADELLRRHYKKPLNRGGLPELPEGWCWATVEQLNPPNRKCAYGVLQPGGDKPDGILLVRVGDINEGMIDVQNMKRIEPEIDARYPRTKLQSGEVLITLVGAIGRTAVVPESLAGANTAHAVGVIPLADEIYAPWVEIWFRNPERIIEMTSKAHEVARKTLNLEDVRAAKVALPPLEEQRIIVAEVERRLSVVQEVEAAVQANLRRATRMRQAILKRAFEGRLVRHDSQDMPAQRNVKNMKPEQLELF